MSVELLKERFKKFAINTALYLQKLPKTMINTPYSNQLIRASSSPGANYRSACRAKSTADFINKLKIIEEELDESIFFLELLDHFNEEYSQVNKALIKEANELLAITVQSIKTSRAKQDSIKKL
jgi:four helix bundle protein